MKPTSCSHEQSIIAAVQTGTWTDALRMHLSTALPVKRLFRSLVRCIRWPLWKTILARCQMPK